jgi:hypothetical protein
LRPKAVAVSPRGRSRDSFQDPFFLPGGTGELDQGTSSLRLLAVATFKDVVVRWHLFCK